MSELTVTVAVPTLDEERHLDACLDAVAAQTYARVVQVLVVDGGSSDLTRTIAAARPHVQLLDNPRRIQAAALNIALSEAKGDVFVRIDGHCVVAPDYIERCVAALEETGAAMVGGGMTPVAESWMQRGIAAAMSSRVGAGPARFHVGGPRGWVDTVYLGAFRAAAARATGGYDEAVGVNEDAELAIRMQPYGGVWFEPAIHSTYLPRSTLPALARQFLRYGRSRAATVRKHPRSLSWRQLAAPALLAGLVSPFRRPVAQTYLLLVASCSALEARRSGLASVAFACALPVMHVSWAVGFVVGLVRPMSVSTGVQAPLPARD